MSIWLNAQKKRLKFKKKLITLMFLIYQIHIEMVFFLIIDKYIYIVLPYCNKGDLGKELLQKKKIPEDDAIKILF